MQILQSLQLSFLPRLFLFLLKEHRKEVECFRLLTVGVLVLGICIASKVGPQMSVSRIDFWIRVFLSELG